MNMARISVNHLERQKRLHLDPFYGDEASLYAPLVVLFTEQYRAKSVSDYGAGKWVLQKKIIELGLSGLKYYPYDPVFEAKNTKAQYCSQSHQQMAHRKRKNAKHNG